MRVVGVKEPTHQKGVILTVTDNGLAIQNEHDLRSKLDALYQQSKSTGKPFNNLVDLMTKTETIISAIHNIKANKGSLTKGVDGRTINHYLKMEPAKLVSVVRKAISNYTPKPVRRVYIPKANGKKRPLGIPTLLDRIIQELARIVLEPIAEGKFFKHSYGFRPLRSTHHAIARVVDLVNRTGYHHVIEGDIESFFDNINHNKLIEIMWGMGIRDKRLLMLVKKMLKAGIMEDGKLLDNDSGTPQGGIISPILANIYLNGFDWLIANEYENHPARFTVKDPRTHGFRKLSQRGHEGCYLIRYADDWIILCQSKTKAEKILKKAEKYFKHVLKLNLSKEKTVITDISTTPAKFLGFNIIAERGRAKDKIFGKPIPDQQKLRKKQREVLKVISELKQKGFEDKFLAAEIERINSKIVGISNYFSIGICNKVFKRLSWEVTNTMFKVFKKHKGDQWKDYFKPASECNNRYQRHNAYSTRTFMVKVDGVNIGLTLYSFTNSYRAHNFNQDMTLYTSEGRKLWAERSKKKAPLLRPCLYDPDDLIYLAFNSNKAPVPHFRRNFEFIMNREYAFNRDKGLCACCKEPLDRSNLECHHKDPSLPPNKVNKVPNLISLCIACHKTVHGAPLPEEPKVASKIIKLRELLTKAN